jgi:hypothetical protein
MILTSDYATFYSLPSLPLRLIPIIRKNKFPPYGLRKIESIVNSKIVPPKSISKYLNNDKILGIYVNDPLVQTEVSKGLTKIFGEEPYHYYTFKSFSNFIAQLKKKYDFKVIIGGPGAWEITIDRPEWVDTILLGEAEVSLPKIIEKASFPKTAYGEKTERFTPIRGPSALSEVEIKRKDRKIPLDVIRSELEIQSKYHDYVNLISDDLLSYGTEEEVIELLKLSSRYGKVIFSQISLVTSYNFNFEKIKTVLNLSENNWRSPVLSGKPGICTLDLESEILKELNKNYIYPLIYVNEEIARELMKYKCIIVPLPTTEKYYEILYESWVHNRLIFKSKLNRIIDFILYKNKETKGEYLKKLKIRGFHLYNVILILISSYLTKPAVSY